MPDTQALAVQEAPKQTLVQFAISRGAGVDTLERLAKLQYDSEDRQARIEFDEALNRCQAAMKRVRADMENPQTHSKYASYAALDRAIRPTYAEEGFSISFGEDVGSTAEYIVMLAYLSRGGHTRIYRKGMPIDTKGPKGNDVMTKVHASGSAGSYAKRYLLKDIFNLAIGEDDNDGNGAELSDAIKITVNAISDCADPESLKEKYRKEYKAAVEANDSTAVKAFMDAYSKRKSELNG